MGLEAANGITYFVSRPPGSCSMLISHRLRVGMGGMGGVGGAPRLGPASERERALGAFGKMQRYPADLCI